MFLSNFLMIYVNTFNGLNTSNVIYTNIYIHIYIKREREIQK